MTDTLPPPDEREAFEAWLQREYPLSWARMTAHETGLMWDSWQARAALPAAQPEPVAWMVRKSDLERCPPGKVVPWLTVWLPWTLQFDRPRVPCVAGILEYVPLYAAQVAAQPTSGVRGPECALVCQEHKAGREACKLGACVRTAGVQPSQDRLAWALRQIAQLDPKTDSIGTAVMFAQNALDASAIGGVKEDQHG
jgi:hypothetical protein